MIQKEALVQVFFYEFCKNFQDSFFAEYLRPTGSDPVITVSCSIFHFFGKLLGLATDFFYKKVFFKYFAKFTGEYMCRSLFLNKVAGIRPETLLKRDPDTSVFQ